MLGVGNTFQHFRKKSQKLPKMFESLRRAFGDVRISREIFLKKITEVSTKILISTDVSNFTDMS